ncbi:Uridylate kinase [Chlamydiales bacterium STE3]|nr:Uridylate kinase [Chlamydiales bacterium STE3]
MPQKKRKRLLLKLSGEILQGPQPFGIDAEACKKLSLAIRQIQSEGYDLGIVIGAGNLFRGMSLSALGMPRTPADQIGMLATIMNGIAMQQALEAIDCRVKVMSALECPRAVESYNWANAVDYLREGVILLFAGGTGNPYFTTDTAAALRASEIQADILLKATKVDGIYSQDPQKFAGAKRYESLTYDHFLAEKLQVMDATAVTICRNNKIPILVFNMNQLGVLPIAHLVEDKNLATIIKD